MMDLPSHVFIKTICEKLGIDPINVTHVRLEADYGSLPEIVVYTIDPQSLTAEITRRWAITAIEQIEDKDDDEAQN